TRSYGDWSSDVCSSDLFDFEHNVEVALSAAVGARFAFARHAQARAGIDAGRNAQLDGFLAFDAALSAALRAALFHDLTRALAREIGRASCRERVWIVVG